MIRYGNEPRQLWAAISGFARPEVITRAIMGGAEARGTRGLRPPMPGLAACLALALALAAPGVASAQSLGEVALGGDGELRRARSARLRRPPHLGGAALRRRAVKLAANGDHAGTFAVERPGAVLALSALWVASLRSNRC